MSIISTYQVHLRDLGPKNQYKTKFHQTTGFHHHLMNMTLTAYQWDTNELSSCTIHYCFSFHLSKLIVFISCMPC